MLVHFLFCMNLFVPVYRVNSYYINKSLFQSLQHYLTIRYTASFNMSLDNDEQRKRSRKSITFVTSNKKKLEEFTSILSCGTSVLPFDLDSHSLDLPELQGASPTEVAIEKCRIASTRVTGAVITEDTSLCFNALGGLPGIYIKVLIYHKYI